MPRLRNPSLPEGITRNADNAVPDARERDGDVQGTGRRETRTREGSTGRQVQDLDVEVKNLLQVMIDLGIIEKDENQRLGFRITFEFLSKMIDVLGAIRMERKYISESMLRMSILSSVLDYYGGKMNQEASDITSILESMIIQDDYSVRLG